MENKVIFKEIELDNTLTSMSLIKSDLLESILYGASEKALCTTNDPIGFDSYVVYARIARRMREIHCSENKGWIKDDTNNQAAIKHPEKMLRIVPCNFDEFAGNKLIDSTNKSPKGEVSRKKSLNNGTAWLPNLPDIDYQDDDGYRTWVLGVYVDDEGKIGAELSFPVSFEGGYFTRFSQRIILLSRTDAPVATERKEYTANDAVEIVDIDIKRK